SQFILQNINNSLANSDCTPHGQSLGEGVSTQPSDELTTNHRLIEETASEKDRKSFQCLKNGFNRNSAPRSEAIKKPKALRLLINARERRRVHDLNDALDDLRAVTLYPTLLLAKNHILLQARALKELCRINKNTFTNTFHWFIPSGHQQENLAAVAEEWK
uniref:Class E basic helix-loop-helix protein 22 n=1 Tax=Cyprinus carpio TaxID=7962 RepID=A0A8C1RGB1_CYPCA